MIPRRFRPIAAAALAAAGVFAWAPAQADAVDDFYKGRTLTILVPVSAGGVYGTFAQILERHIRKHLPDGTHVQLQYMTGAGGMRALNWAYNAGPKDGSMVVTPTSGIVSNAVLSPEGIKYKPGEFNFLGGWGEATNTCSLMKPAAVQTLAEAKKKEVVLGSVGKATSSYQLPAMLNELLGTKFKIISGYRGGSPVRLAMEKGEVDGWCGLWLGWKARKPEWIRQGKLLHLMQMASKPTKGLEDVPLLTELAENDEQRQIFSFLTDTGLTGFTFVAPPGVPEPRMARLAKAYADTLHDPAFLADAEKRNYPIDPLSREDVQGAVKRILSTPPEIVDKAKKAMGIGKSS